MVRANLLLDYVTMLFARLDCPYDDANTVARVLVEADLRGIASQGVSRVMDFYYLTVAGRAKVHPNVQVVYQSPSTATMDADSSLGPVVAKRAMELAMEKARTAGTGWVAVRDSHHFGMGAYYAMMALEADMVGIVMSNAPPIVAPVYGSSRMLGANPMAMAVPTHRHPPLVIDFTTSVLSEEGLEVVPSSSAHVPQGVLQDAVGNPSTDLSTLDRGGALLPLGGDLAHGSHKGFCLGAIVDMFASLFGGACFGPFVPPQVAYRPVRPAPMGDGLGHFFGAIRADAFRPIKEFKAWSDAWIDTFRNAKGIGGTPGIIIPGDKERSTREARLKNGIPLTPRTLQRLASVAQQLECEPLPYQPD